MTGFDCGWSTILGMTYRRDFLLLASLLLPKRPKEEIACRLEALKLLDFHFGYQHRQTSIDSMLRIRIRRELNDNRLRISCC